jgi:glycosyltransferase involved in cell wall biosynthesis
MINKKIKVVPNGVNTDQFEPINKEKQRKWMENYFRVEFSSDLNIINVGRLSQEKGIQYLSKSLKYLPPATKLFIVGDRCICFTSHKHGGWFI